MEQPSLKQLIQSLIPDQGGVILAVIKSASPLKIQAVNDEKLIIGENSVIVPRHLLDYRTVIDIPELGLENAEMNVYNSLVPGELVYLLSFNQGEKYFILDRV